MKILMAIVLSSVFLMACTEGAMLPEDSPMATPADAVHTGDRTSTSTPDLSSAPMPTPTPTLTPTPMPTPTPTPTPVVQSLILRVDEQYTHYPWYETKIALPDNVNAEPKIYQPGHYPPITSIEVRGMGIEAWVYHPEDVIFNGEVYDAWIYSENESTLSLTLLSGAEIIIVRDEELEEPTEVPHQIHKDYATYINAISEGEMTIALPSKQGFVNALDAFEKEYPTISLKYIYLKELEFSALKEIDWQTKEFEWDALFGLEDIVIGYRQDLQSPNVARLLIDWVNRNRDDLQPFVTKASQTETIPNMACNEADILDTIISIDNTKMASVNAKIKEECKADWKYPPYASLNCFIISNEQGFRDQISGVTPSCPGRGRLEEHSAHELGLRYSIKNTPNHHIRLQLWSSDGTFFRSPSTRLDYVIAVAQPFTLREFIAFKENQ